MDGWVDGWMDAGCGLGGEFVASLVAQWQSERVAG